MNRHPAEELGVALISSSGKEGSGTILGSNGIITARHIVAAVLSGSKDDCQARREITADNQSFRCMLVYENAVRDIAILEVCGESKALWLSKPAPARLVIAETGANNLDVRVVGFPDATVDEDGQPGPDDVEAVLLTAGAGKDGRVPLDVSTSVPKDSTGWKGMSGAGVRDRYGRLVAVVVETSAERQQRRLYASLLPDPDEDAEFASALETVGAPKYLESSTAPTAKRILLSVDQRGRPIKAKDSALNSLGVRYSRNDIDTGGNPFYPYIMRDVDKRLDAALDARVLGSNSRILLLSGDAMAGKSRAMAEAIQRHRVIRDWIVLQLKPGVGVAEIALLKGSAGAVLWLDDIDEHLQWISPNDLTELLESNNSIIVGTVRSDALIRSDFTMPRSSRSLLEDAALVELIKMPSVWSQQERSNAEGVVPRLILSQMELGKSLGEVLGAGQEMIRRLEVAGNDLHRALADLMADWPRTGIPMVIRDIDAMRILPAYLSPERRANIGGMAKDDYLRFYESIRDWLCEPVAGSTTSIVVRRRGGLEIDDLFLQRRAASAVSLSRELFEFALLAAARQEDSVSVMEHLSYNAYVSGWTRLAPDAGDSWLDDSEEHEPTLIEKAARLLMPTQLKMVADTSVTAGQIAEVLVIGCLPRPLDVVSARVYIDCVISYDYRGLDIQYIPLGKGYVVPVLRKKRADTRKRVALQVLLGPGRYPSGYAFSERVMLQLPQDAVGPIATRNVNLGWELAAELSVKWSSVKWSSARVFLPLDVSALEGPEQVPVTVSGEVGDVNDAVELRLSGLPSSPFRSGDQFHGTLSVTAKNNLILDRVNVKLIRKSFVSGVLYGTSYQSWNLLDKNLNEPDVSAQATSVLDFVCDIPLDIGAPSVRPYTVGQRVEGYSRTGVPNLKKGGWITRIISVEWYIEATVTTKGNYLSAAKARSDVVVLRSRDAGRPVTDNAITGDGGRAGAAARFFSAASSGPEMEAVNESANSVNAAAIPISGSIDGRWETLRAILLSIFDENEFLMIEPFADIAWNRDGVAISGLLSTDDGPCVVTAVLTEGPLELGDVGPHLAQVFGIADRCGLMLSFSGYTPEVIDEFRAVLLSHHPVILADAQKLARMSVASGRAATWLECCLREAVSTSNPLPEY